METLYLKIKNKKTMSRILDFVKKFDASDIEICKFPDEFELMRESLHKELLNIDSEKFVKTTLKDFDEELELVIKSHES